MVLIMTDMVNIVNITYRIVKIVIKLQVNFLN
jgi:hypothetical protein